MNRTLIFYLKRSYAMKKIIGIVSVLMATLIIVSCTCQQPPPPAQPMPQQSMKGEG